jgi:hypothetical protein
MVKPKDFSQLSVTHPEIFAKLMKLFENPRIQSGGIKSIAIPIDGEIPDWVKPYIKIEEIIENNIRLILPVLNSLGMKVIGRTKSSKFFSNIVQL